MRLLGIDHGLKKVGLAMATTKIAEPLAVVRFESEDELLAKIREIIKKQEVEEIVVGLSEGKMASASKAFGERLKEASGLPVIFQDETLSTLEAQDLSLKAGIKKRKRRRMEDAFSAAVILQAFIDRN